MPALLYGLAAYLLFLATILYAVGFTANALVPKSIDTGSASPPAVALAVDLLLLSLFAIQHSVMARPAFKRWWTRIVPPAIERSTYVALASLALVLLFWQWRPLPAGVWQLEGPWAMLAWVGFVLGWALVVVSTFLLSHFELFGVLQVLSRYTGRALPEATFRTPSLYRYLRHPIYAGFLLAFWSTPHMTQGHLLFASTCTAYILIGITLEERDLVAHFGDRYRQYKREVGMLWPKWPG